MKIIIFAFIIFTSTNSYCLETILLGGGGEPKKQSTIFDESLKILASKKEALGLKVHSVFNSGHADTELILSTQLKATNTSFTSENFDKTIENFVAKIESGEIAEGEKLLIIVDSHGGAKQKNQQTHSIAMVGSNLTDLSKVEGEHTESMDKLKALSDIALAKGIKLGILDFSCHSGNSLSLANKNTCVITASGPNHFAFASFPSQFYNEMKPGLSLEDVFLNTRKVFTSPSFPMISTSAGLSLNDELYSLFSAYLNTTSKDGIADKLSPYISKIATPIGICQREDEYQILLKKVQDFVAINGKLTSQFGATEDLVEALANYKKYQDDLIQEISPINAKLKESIELEYYVYVNRPGLRLKVPKTEKIQIEDLFKIYKKSNIPSLEALLEEELKKIPTNQTAIDELEVSVFKYKKIDELRKKVLEQNTGLITRVENIYDSLPAKYDELWQRAVKISELANHMYMKGYKDKKILESASDACSDFKL